MTPEEKELMEKCVTQLRIISKHASWCPTGVLGNQCQSSARMFALSMDAGTALKNLDTYRLHKQGVIDNG